MSSPNLPDGLPRPSPSDPGDIEIPPILDPEVEELWSSRALLLVLSLLILSFWVSYYLKVRRIRSVHETIVALFAGMVIGAIVRLSPGTVVQNMISFKSTILLNVLLPPIILNSGYQLKQENFFRNFAVILSFAFAGTFISAVVLGVIVYLYSLLGLEGLSLGIIECLLFGSTLSATDPVTILAIFHALHVDPKLYSVIFGESILNDAVAIVMFETLSQFHGSSLHILSFFHGVGIFLLTFFTSMALGVIFGLTASLGLKHSELNRYPEIESCLVFLVAYTSYFFSNAVTMSGIVSLLFCGITLKHYAYHNMSLRTQRTTKYLFGILAQLSENFIFIYLGLSLFTQTMLVYKPLFIFITAIAVCVARYCAVFPISSLINFVFRARGSRNDELPHSYQMMLFWAGLRGAVGVALAAGMKGPHAVALRTTVLVTVVITVVVFGGTIGRMIEILGIRTGVEEDESDEDEEVDVENRPSASHKRSRSALKRFDLSATASSEPYRDRVPLASPHANSSESDSESDGLPPPAVANDGTHDVTRVWRDGQWFTVLDERYLLPVFSNATASRRQASKKALKKRGSFNESDMPGASDLSRTQARRDYNASFTDILSELVAAPLATGSPAATSKRRDAQQNGDVNDTSVDLSLTSTTTTGPGHPMRSRPSSNGSALNNISERPSSASSAASGTYNASVGSPASRRGQGGNGSNGSAGGPSPFA